MDYEASESAMKHRLGLFFTGLLIGLTITPPPIQVDIPSVMAQLLDPRTMKADRLHEQGIHQLKLSKFREALASFTQALEIYQSIGDQPGAATALGNLGNVYEALGDYQKAIESHKKSLVLKIRIGNRKGEINSLGNIGLAYFNLGQYDLAIQFLEKSLAKSRQIQFHHAEAIILSNLGRVYTALSQYARSIELHQQALKIKRQLGEPRGQAKSYLALGNVAFRQSKYNLAIDYYQQALNILKEVGDRQGEANSIGSLALVYNQIGQYKRALNLYEETLATAQEIGDRKSEATALGNLGATYNNLGDYHEAINFHQRSLEVRRAIQDRSGEASSLSGLGVTYRSLGEYVSAIDYLNQALAVNRAIGNRRGEAINLGDLGSVYLNLGQYQRAIELYQQTVAVAREIGAPDTEATFLGNLGVAYQDLEQYDKALEFFQAALNINTDIGNRPGAAKNLGNLGSTYRFLGQYDQAFKFLRKALSIKIEINDRQGEAITLSNLGRTFASVGDHQQAIQNFDQALGISQDIGDRHGESTTYGFVGESLINLEEPELAVIHLKQSINLREKIRGGLRTLPREDQQSYKQTVAYTYQRLATQLLDQGRVMEALLALDLLKVQELQDFLQNVKGNQQTNQGIELLSQERAILAEVKTKRKLELNSLLASTSVKTLIQQLRQTAAAQNLQLASYQDLQASLSKLGQNSALFYPLVTDNQLELVIFTRNAPPIHRRVPVSKNELEQTVAQFRTQMNDRSDAIRQTAQQLYTWLIEPINTDLERANIQTLIYAPDGQMRYVPLAALYDGNQWLVEQYQLNYITALSLTDLDSQSFQQPRILAGAFTDPTGQVQVDQQNFSFRAIPAARKEVEALAQTFTGTKTLLGPDFTRKALTTEQLNQYNIVHLATHGQLVSGNPEESFILLNNKEHISLREIKDWQLPNVGLVVLSACQTALGNQLGNGIEIIGFGYQLQQAQARAAISTLWRINDATTSDLMDAFYDRLKQGSPNPVDALGQAQMALIKGDLQSNSKRIRGSVVQTPGKMGTFGTINRDRSHPYYWAPFILIGNGL